MRTRLGCLFALALTACAPVSTLPAVDRDLAEAEAQRQYDLAFEGLVRNSAWACRVAYPILTANVELCGDDVAPLPGFFVATQSTLPKNFRRSAAAMFGVDDRITVIAVTSGSAAHLGGLRPGDKILAVGDWTVPTGRKAHASFGAKLDARFSADAPTIVQVRRGEQTHVVTVRPAAACDYPVSAAIDEAVGAFADGKNVTISSGMMRFAETDEELANVISHEVAHNAMGHISKSGANANIGLLLDVLAAGFGVNTGGAFSKVGADAFSQSFEAEADYVGLYMMARAGYAIDNAADFWRRMGAANPGAISLKRASTHPATPERFIALEKTVVEIEAKRTARLPLLPGRTDDASETNLGRLETILPANPEAVASN